MPATVASEDSSSSTGSGSEGFCDHAEEITGPVAVLNHFLPITVSEQDDALIDVERKSKRRRGEARLSRLCAFKRKARSSSLLKSVPEEASDTASIDDTGAAVLPQQWNGNQRHSRKSCSHEKGIFWMCCTTSQRDEGWDTFRNIEASICDS